MAPDRPAAGRSTAAESSAWVVQIRWTLQPFKYKHRALFYSAALVCAGKTDVNFLRMGDRRGFTLPDGLG